MCQNVGSAIATVVRDKVPRNVRNNTAQHIKNGTIELDHVFVCVPMYDLPSDIIILPFMLREWAGIAQSV